MGRFGKLYLAVGAGVLLVILFVVFVVVGGGDKQPGGAKTPATPKTLKARFEPTALSYAGNPVYDACSLLTLNTVKKHVDSYKSILANLGTDKVASDPLKLEHNYVDRDIPASLGNDGQPRPAGLTAGPRAFASVFDSSCVYGQGDEIGKRTEFASVYVTQKPTPLSPEFLAYLASIDAQKQTYVQLDAYPVAPAAGDDFFSVIMVPHDKRLAVIFRTANKDLAAAGADEIGKKLEAAPSGPLSLTYPAPYQYLVNPCGLLTAPEFARVTGKPASALAQETLYLTDINTLSVAEALHPLVSGVRTCRRVEVDRSLTDNIAATSVTLRQFRNEASAKKYVQDLKADDIDGLTVKPVPKVSGASEAYVKADDDPNPAVSGYTFEMRIGTAIISLQVDGDVLRADSSAEAYAARLLPAARAAAQHYQQQAK